MGRLGASASVSVRAPHSPSLSLVCLIHVHWPLKRRGSKSASNLFAALRFFLLGVAYGIFSFLCLDMLRISGQLSTQSNWEMHYQYFNTMLAIHIKGQCGVYLISHS